MPVIVSIQAGRPTDYLHAGATDGQPRTWTTAFFKKPLAGSVHIGSVGVAGDGQADLENHGGPDKAVLAYSADHYVYWLAQLGLSEMPLGAFGENLSILELDESSVCIGDRWQAENAIFEVSQPRQPCWKMSRRWNISNLAAQVIGNGRSGWYLRVLSEGEIAAPCEISLLSRPHPSWTVARANRVMHQDKDDLESAAKLAALPELSAAWRTSLSKRLTRHTS